MEQFHDGHHVWLRSRAQGTYLRADSDFETVKKIIDAKQPKASQSLKELAAQSNAHSDRENWTYLDWMKKDSEGLARMKKENPSEFARLQATLKH